MRHLRSPTDPIGRIAFGARPFAKISGRLLRSLMRDKGKVAADWFTHTQNKETITQIGRLISALADLNDTSEIPSEFYTTRHLMDVSMQIMSHLESRTGDPMALFRRIRERERILAQHIKTKDMRIIEIARIERSVGFLFTPMLCVPLNYARFMLKGGIIGRALTPKRLIAEVSDIFDTVENIPNEIGKKIAPLARQVSRNTETVGNLARKFYGVTNEKGNRRVESNAFVVGKAVERYYKLIQDGVKPINALTDGCREIENEYGLGHYKNFTTFRNMVSRIIAPSRK